MMRLLKYRPASMERGSSGMTSSGLYHLEYMPVPLFEWSFPCLLFQLPLCSPDNSMLAIAPSPPSQYLAVSQDTAQLMPQM